MMSFNEVQTMGVFEMKCGGCGNCQECEVSLGLLWKGIFDQIVVKIYPNSVEFYQADKFLGGFARDYEHKIDTEFYNENTCKTIQKLASKINAAQNFITVIVDDKTMCFISIISKEDPISQAVATMPEEVKKLVDLFLVVPSGTLLRGIFNPASRGIGIYRW